MSRTLTKADEPANESRLTAGSPIPYLFVILECGRLQAGSARYSLADLTEVTIGRGAERIAVRSDGKHLGVGVPDGHMSAQHVQLRRTRDAWWIHDHQSKNGTFVDDLRIRETRLADGDTLRLGHTLFRYREIATPIGVLPLDCDGAALSELDSVQQTILPVRGLFAKLPDIARSSLPVLIEGESGTGKEALARALHNLSGARGPFVVLNCAAPTAANRLDGARFESGHLGSGREQGTTLFLDEIADASSSAQLALMQTIQTASLSADPNLFRSSNIRLIAATRHRVARLVATQRLRSDLFARFAAMRLQLMPLRERIEDLGQLVALFLRRVAPDGRKPWSMSVAAASLLLRHPWPFNLLELEQALASALVLAGDGTIEPSHFIGLTESAPIMSQAGGNGSMKTPTREQVMALLKEHGGNISAAARAVGKSRVQIQRWAKRYGADLDSLRSDAASRQERASGPSRSKAD